MRPAFWSFNKKKPRQNRRGLSRPHSLVPICLPHALVPSAPVAQGRVLSRRCSAILKIHATSNSWMASGSALTRLVTRSALCASRAGPVRSTGKRMTRLRLLMWSSEAKTMPVSPLTGNSRYYRANEWDLGNCVLNSRAEGVSMIKCDRTMLVC